MNQYRADLHIHTCLSPCASLDMTPATIVEKALVQNLNIIGITDHNSTRNAELVARKGRDAGLLVLMGAEVTTREEVHCLVFFEDPHELKLFQQFIDERITRIPNLKGHFGYQPVIDENENIVEMISYYLPAALTAGINEVQQKTASLGGMFIPAHIDRPSNGILSQLGFIPPGLIFDGLGISRTAFEKHVVKHCLLNVKTSFLTNSDSHYPEQIGEIYSVFHMQHLSFEEVRKAMHKVGGRFIETV